MIEHPRRTPLVVGDDALPTEDDVAFYSEHGYYISKRILPDEVIDAARRGIDLYFAGERDDLGPATTGYSDWHLGDDPSLRNVEFLAFRNRGVRALVLATIIGAVAAKLAGADIIRLWDDQLVWKEPVDGMNPAGIVGWHADRAYWRTCSSESMLTAWIPLHDCPAEMGPLQVIDGSHLWRDTDNMRSFRETDLTELGLSLQAAVIADRTRTISLAKGQVSFNHCRTVHSSDVNRGTVPRVSLAVHLQDGANRWCPHLNEAGVAWELPNDRMARRLTDGRPDYTDPTPFPVLWSS